MDLKIYYQKIREEQAKILEDYPVVVSEATENGGKAGVAVEVSKALAAQMIVDGTARAATAAEANSFRQAKAAAKRQADEAAAAAKPPFDVVPKKG